MELTEKTRSQKRVFTGRLIHVRHDEVILPDGTETIREVVEHPGGVAIAALTDQNELPLVDQFRYAQQRIMREVPAGKRELGEDPLVTAKRELQEETGYQAEEFVFLGEMVPTGAYLEETIQMYWAKGLTFVGTHLDEDEFLNCVKVPLKEVVDQVMCGAIIDGKTIAMTLKLQAMLEEEQ